MEAIQIRMPRTQWRAFYLSTLVVFLLWAGSCVYMILHTSAELQALAREGERYGLKPDVSLNLHPYLLPIAAVCLLFLGYLLGMRWIFRRMSYVMDETGIRAERVLWAGPPVAWSEVREIHIFKGWGLVLRTANNALRLQPWVYAEVWPEIERRLHPRLEQDRWWKKRWVVE